MLPTFFIIGATRAGTTSLSQYLGSHPEVHMSPYKEPHFFVTPGDGLPTVANQIATRLEYERLFESDCAVRGEASTSYSHFPARRGVPERIRDMVPDAKIVYLVRDPIDRLVSHYLHEVAYGGERRSLELAVGDIARPDNIYICAGRYATQLERYWRVFGSGQVCVLDQAELHNSRVSVLRRVYQFLEVDPSFRPRNCDAELNATVDRRRYGRRYAALRGRGPLRRLPTPVRAFARQVAERAEKRIWPPLEKPQMSAALRERLREVFEDEVLRLRAMTGQAFDTWPTCGFAPAADRGEHNADDSQGRP